MFKENNVMNANEQIGEVKEIPADQVNESISKVEMAKLLEDANKLIEMNKNSDEFKKALEAVAARAEEVKKTPLGDSEQFYAVAKILMDTGGRSMDVTTEMGRDMLRKSTDELYENVRNQMRSENEAFETKVNHYLEFISKGLADAGDQKENVRNNVLAGLAADLDHGVEDPEEAKVLAEVMNRVKQLQ